MQYFLEKFYQNLNQISVYFIQSKSFLKDFRYILASNFFLYKRLNFFSRRFGRVPRLEFIWTVIPSLILFFLALPTMVFLYEMDVQEVSTQVLQITGHQWYWTYITDSICVTLEEFDNLINDNHIARIEEEARTNKYPIIEDGDFSCEDEASARELASSFNFCPWNDAYSVVCTKEAREIMYSIFHEIGCEIENSTWSGYLTAGLKKTVCVLFGVEYLSLFEAFARDSFHRLLRLEWLFHLSPKDLLSIGDNPFNSYILMSRMFRDIDLTKLTEHTTHITFHLDSPLEMEQYQRPTSSLEKGELRLLETTTPFHLPINTNIKLIITSVDVLHSWTVPGFGIKLDAIPGRLNITYLHCKLPGVFYGQCSELCGINHGFMPIQLSFVS